MTKEEVIRVLMGNGFTIIGVEPKPNYHCFVVERVETLGARVRYSLVVASDKLTPGDIAWLENRESTDTGHVILVGDPEVEPSLPVLTHAQFMDRLGGPILSLLPLHPHYGDNLITLGSNSCPTGLQGEASDLFEEYVHAGLQYLLGSRVLRYGQERRFENVADGVTFNDVIPIVIYDCKSAKDGYEASADSVRQFAKYVDDFNGRYGARIGRVYSFLVVSTNFTNGPDSMKNQSANLRASTEGTTLTFVRSEDLATMVSGAIREPNLRRSLDWKRLLATESLTAEAFESNLAERRKDQI